MRCDFVDYDDPAYVGENRVLAGGFSWHGVAWAFTTLTGANWHPVTWLSHMLDCQFFGLKPGWHHAVNVALHAANAILLFLVFRRMTGAVADAMLAALFALHPLHVESVAWLSERKDVLSTFDFMLTLLAYRSTSACASVRLRPGGLVGSLRADVQTDAGHAAAGVAHAGLLAAGAVLHRHVAGRGRNECGRGKRASRSSWRNCRSRRWRRPPPRSP